MADTSGILCVKMKENILALVNDCKLPEAQALLDEYRKIASDDIEAFSIQCVIAIKNGNLDMAQQAIEQGLAIDKNDFDLRYNLAYLYEQKEKYAEAVRMYCQLSKGDYTEEQKNIVNQAIDNIKNQYPDATLQDTRQRVAFICLNGLDSFINDIAGELAEEYNVKKFLVENDQAIFDAVDWADIIWLEWGNESSVVATRYAGIIGKRVIVRIHGYEIFGDMPAQIEWDKVDRLIFVAEHKRELFFKRFGQIVSFDKTCIVRNGIDVTKFNFEKTKTQNKNIAFIGNINYRKGLELLLEFFYDLLQKDPEYMLFIRGNHQDFRYQIAIETMIDELQLGNNVVFVGRVDDINSWLQDKSFIVSSSIEESFHYSVGEGMLAGLKPVVHAWRESRDIWPVEFIYRNSLEFQNIILDNTYEPERYRQYVVDHYSLKKQMVVIKDVIYTICRNKDNEEISPRQSLPTEGVAETNNNCAPLSLMTVGVLNCNQGRHLEECLTSILNQDYPAIEILVIDDYSTDNSLEVINKYMHKHGNIRLIQHKVKSGCAKGWQDVQVNAKGEYFTCLAADAYYPSTTIVSACLAEFEKNKELDYVYGNCQLIGENGNIVNQKHEHYKREELIHQIFLKAGTPIVPIAGVYKKEFFIRNKLNMVYDEKLKFGADSLNLLINLKHDLHYTYIDKNCLCYRQNDDNTIDAPARVDFLVAIIEYITRNFSELIYLPEVRWQEVTNKKLRNAIIMFYLGARFSDAFKVIAATSDDEAWSDGRRLLEILNPLENKMDLHFAKSLEASDIFKKDIGEMKAEVHNIKAHLQDIVCSNKQAILPKVSIIIPTCNSKANLEQTLDSALEQDYTNLEIIVLDDASIDGTDEMVAEFMLDKRVSYHRNENGVGWLENYKQALNNLASGEYVLILNDGEYLIDNSYISRAVNLLLKTPEVMLVYADCNKHDKQKAARQGNKTAKVENGKKCFANYGQIECRYGSRFITSLFNRQKAIEIGVLQENPTDNLLFLTLSLMLEGDVGVLNDCVAAQSTKKASEDIKLQSDSLLELDRIRERALLKGVSKKVLQGLEKLLAKLLDCDITSKIKQQSPLVTVGVTNYNAKDYIEICLQSILEQTYQNIEIIVIDDVSTDGSPEILRQYAERYKNIKLFEHAQNSGSPDLARQEIINTARGEYFMFVDSDDYFNDAHAIEFFVAAAQANKDIDYVYCNLQVVDEHGNPKEIWRGEQYSAERIVHDTFKRGGSGILNVKGLFKTEFFRKHSIAYLNNGTAGDTLTLLSCMKHGMKLKHMDQALIAYRQHGGNFTFNVQVRIKSILRVLNYIVENFDKKIYFPECAWDRANNEQSAAAHAFLLAEFYYSVFKQYYTGNWMPWASDATQASPGNQEYLVPIKKCIIDYIEESAAASMQYKDELNKILVDFDKIYGSNHTLL